jgi:hypothetical protein
MMVGGAYSAVGPALLSIGCTLKGSLFRFTSPMTSEIAQRLLRLVKDKVLVPRDTVWYFLG